MEFNWQFDSKQLNYAQMAMLLCGVSLNVNGIWEETQLFQNILKYSICLEGQDQNIHLEILK